MYGFGFQRTGHAAGQGASRVWLICAMIVPVLALQVSAGAAAAQAKNGAKKNANASKNAKAGNSASRRPAAPNRKKPAGASKGNPLSHAVSEAQQALRNAIAELLQAERQVVAANQRYRELQQRLLGASRRHEGDGGLSRDERELLELQRRLEEARARVVAEVRKTKEYRELSEQAERAKQKLDELRRRPDADPAELLVLSREYAKLHTAMTGMETQAAAKDPTYQKLREELRDRGKAIGEAKRREREATKNDPQVQQLVQQVQQAKRELSEAERLVAMRRQQVQVAQMRLAQVVSAAQLAAAQQRLRQQAGRGRGKGRRGRSRKPSGKKRR